MNTSICVYSTIQRKCKTVISWTKIIFNDKRFLKLNNSLINKILLSKTRKSINWFSKLYKKRITIVMMSISQLLQF